MCCLIIDQFLCESRTRSGLQRLQITFLTPTIDGRPVARRPSSSAGLRATQGYTYTRIYIYIYPRGRCVYVFFFSPFRVARREYLSVTVSNFRLVLARFTSSPHRRRRRWTVGGARQGSKIGICRRRSPFGQNHYCFPSTRRRRTGPPAGPYVSRRVYHLISGSGTRRVVIIIVIIVMGPVRRGFSRSENILHNS